ncbi:GNAT family N-acetyltransferase [Nocardioides gansuensis]|nr:N-acetyltransferase [Nocardioides gansuensis]
MTYQIRRATARDLAAVEQVVFSAYEPWVDIVGGRPGPMDEDFAALIADGKVHVAVADEVAGLIVLATVDDALLIENVAVAPDHQGRGLGRQLITFAEATAVRRGLRTARLFTHERMTTNITWYERHGYVISGMEPLPFGRLVHLRKSLAQIEG